MSKANKTAKERPINNKEPLRFAHPFVTTVPIEQRAIIAGVGNRMTDYIQTKLEPIPLPKREPTMALSEIIGKDGTNAIQKFGAISFHAVGDTGNELSPMPELIAEAMASDYNVGKPEASPAFFLHLGDVDYYDNTDKGYHAQFYVPYKNYPGKIIAIPGNHDGELFKYDGTSTGQSTTLDAFQKNFCQPKPGVPTAAGTIYREMVSQPAVYWVLNTPFVDVIGLYSNVAENPGFIESSQIGHAQKDWLIKTLSNIQNDRKKNGRKALLIAVHHPPHSANGGHSSSTQMLQDIDDACNKAGIMPDAVLAAHAHNYQRFTRAITFNKSKMQIPFLVCGGGGRGIAQVAGADGKKNGEFTYNKSLMDYSYLLVTANTKQLMLQVYRVDSAGKRTIFDTVTVNLANNSIQ